MRPRPTDDLPRAPGTWTNCSKYQNAVEVPPFRDQRFEKHAQPVTKEVNECTLYVRMAGVLLATFVSWNPSLNADPWNCTLDEQYSYCIYVKDAVTGSSDATLSNGETNCLDQGDPPAGASPGCTCWQEYYGYDASGTVLSSPVDDC